MVHQFQALSCLGGPSEQKSRHPTRELPPAAWKCRANGRRPTKPGVATRFAPSPRLDPHGRGGEEARAGQQAAPFSQHVLLLSCSPSFLPWRPPSRVPTPESPSYLHPLRDYPPMYMYCTVTCHYLPGGTWAVDPPPIRLPSPFSPASDFSLVRSSHGGYSCQIPCIPTASAH
jgi:hypothetical protein